MLNAVLKTIPGMFFKALFSSLIISFIIFLILTGALKLSEFTLNSFISYYAWTYIVIVALTLVLNFAAYQYGKHTFTKWAKKWGVTLEVVEHAMFKLNFAKTYKFAEMDNWTKAEFELKLTICNLANKVVAKAVMDAFLR